MRLSRYLVACATFSFAVACGPQGSRTDAGATGGGSGTGGGLGAAGGAITGGGSAGGSSGGMAAGGEAGGMAAGGAAGGMTAGGEAGGMTAGGEAGGMAAGGAAGGMTAGGTAGGVAALPTETCETAEPLTGPTAVVNGNLAGARDDLRYQSSTVCAGSPSSPGGDLVYSISVPGFSRLSSTLRSSLPDGGQNWDSLYNVIVGPTAAACGAALSDGGFGGQTCVTGVDEPDDPTPAQIFINRTSMAQNAFLVVEAYRADGGGPFTLTANVTPLPEGDVCENATVLPSLPATRASDTVVGYTNDYLGGSFGCASGTGSVDRAYRVSVPANSRLTATVVASTNTDGGIAFAPTVNIVQGACAASLVCVGGGASTATPGTATAKFDNPGSATEFFVIVDTATTNPGGTFELVVTATPITLAPGDVCRNTTAPTTTSQTFQNETFTGFENQYVSQGQTSCSYQPGIDRAYAVTIPAGQVLTAVATPTDAGIFPDGGVMNLSLQVLATTTECASGPCLSNSNAAGSAAETIIRSNANGTSPENVFLVVDSNLGTPTSMGTYSLALTIAPPPMGDTCGSPVALTVGNPAVRDLSGSSNDYSTSTTGCAFRSGRDVVYSIAVPAMQRLTITSAATGTDTSISLVSNAASCGTTCLAFNDAAGFGGTDTLVYDNVTGAVQNLLVVIDSTSSSGSASFTVTASTEAVPTTLNPGETCATAVSVSPGTVSGSLTGLTNDLLFSDVSLCLGAQPGGPDGVYSISVPSTQRLVATLRPTFDATLNAVIGAAKCGTAGADGGTQGINCVAGSDNFGSANETLTYLNASGAAQTVLLLVDSVSSTVGTFDLTTSLSAAAANDVCDLAGPPATADTIISGNLATAFDDYRWSGNPNCVLTGTFNNDQVFAATVQPGQQVTALVTTTSGTWDPAINIVDGTTCVTGGSQTCLTSANNATGTTETAVFQNVDATARTVFIVVDTSSSMPGAFSLGLTFGTFVPNQGETCRAPQLVSMSGTLTGQTTAGYANNIGTVSGELPLDPGACTNFTSTYPGRDRVYQIAVGGGQTLTALVTPTSAFDAAVYFIESPASNCQAMGTTCIGTGDDTNSSGTGTSAAETGTYTNTSGTTQTVFIVVDSYNSSSPGGTYDLTITLAP
jgi:hypothetical protein